MGARRIIIGLVLLSLTFSVIDANAAISPKSGSNVEGLTPLTSEQFRDKWKAFYQIYVNEINKLAGAPRTEYKNPPPADPIFRDGMPKENYDAIDDYGRRLAAWFAVEKASIEPKAPTVENKSLPDLNKWSKENCESSVKSLISEAVLSFNPKIKAYGTTSYRFREPIPTTACFENDSDGNQKRYFELGATLKKWLVFESSNISFGRLIFDNLPSLDLVGKIYTEDQFYQKVDSYRNTKKSLQLMNASSEKLDKYVAAQLKAQDVSYGYEYKNPEPLRPLFQASDPSENFASLVVWGYLYQLWVDAQLVANEPLIFTKQFNPGQQKLACNLQSAANTSSFTLIRASINSAYDSIQLQAANKDLVDKKISTTEISEVLSKLQKALDTYNEKLPVYFNRDQSCEIYSAQIIELQGLYTSLKIAQSQLEKLKNGDLKITSQYSEKKFDLKIDEAIKSTKKALSQKPLGSNSKVPAPLICGKNKNSIQLTTNARKCPTGLIKIS